MFVCFSYICNPHLSEVSFLPQTLTLLLHNHTTGAISRRVAPIRFVVEKTTLCSAIM